MLFSTLLILVGAPSIYSQLDLTAHGPALDAVHRQLHDNCVKEHPVTDDEISAVSRGHFDDDDERMKDYILCLWSWSGIIDLKTFRLNKVLLDVYVPKVMHKGDGVNLFLDCSTEGRELPAGTPLRERTWVLMKCVQRNDPEHFIMY